jgi:hypothetical protein
MMHQFGVLLLSRLYLRMPKGKRCEGWFEPSDATLGRLWSMSIAKGTSRTNDNSNEGDDIKRWDKIANGGV